MSERTGVALFDTPKTPLDAWICESGGEPQRIGHVSDLPAHVLWVSNLPFTTFQNLNLFSVPNIKDTQYLRTPVDALRLEAGLSEPREAAAHLAAVCHEVRRLGKDILDVPWGETEYRYLRLLGDVLASGGLRDRPAGAVAPAVTAALDGAMQVNQGMHGVFRPMGARPYQFLAPRFAYNRWLLGRDYPQAGVPWAPWDHFPKKPFGTEEGHRLPNTDRVVESVIDLAGEGRTLLCEVELHGMDRDHSAYAHFGAGCKTIRNAVSLPELMGLLGYAKLTVRRAYTAPVSTLTLPRKLTRWLAERGQDLGMAAGLFLENCVAGISSVPQSAPTPPASAVWMRAYDRAFCTRQATRFVAKGLLVGSFSYGRLVLMLRHGELRTACACGLEHRMLPAADTMAMCA